MHTHNYHQSATSVDAELLCHPLYHSHQSYIPLSLASITQLHLPSHFFKLQSIDCQRETFMHTYTFSFKLFCLIYNHACIYITSWSSVIIKILYIHCWIIYITKYTIYRCTHVITHQNNIFNIFYNVMLKHYLQFILHYIPTWCFVRLILSISSFFRIQNALWMAPNMQNKMKLLLWGNIRI